MENNGVCRGAVHGRAASAGRWRPITGSETQPLKLNRKREIADHLRERMKTSLVLTPEQEQKFEPVIQATASEMEASHGACLNRISTALDKMHGLSIKPDLTQEQHMVKLKQLQADRRDLMWKKYSYSHRGDGTGRALNNVHAVERVRASDTTRKGLPQAAGMHRTLTKAVLDPGHISDSEGGDFNHPYGSAVQIGKVARAAELLRCTARCSGVAHGDGLMDLPPMRWTRGRWPKFLKSRAARRMVNPTPSRTWPALRWRGSA